MKRYEFIKLLQAKVNMSEQELLRLRVIDDYDLLNQDEHITKKDAARIFHRVLLMIVNEKDDSDWTAATVLKDLYDCHSCVSHISQIYVKGILEASSENIFGNNEELGEDEAIKAYDRIYNKEIRLKVNEIQQNYHEVELSRVDEIKLGYEKVHLIDVRNEEDVCFDGYKKIPLKKIMQNPYCITSDKTEPVILRCQKGYLASIAGNLLLDHGYTNVYVIL